MKKIFFCLLSLTLLVACTSEKTKLQQKISGLDNTDSLSTSSGLASFYQSLTTYIEKYPEDARTREYLYKAAQSCNGLGKHAEAIQLFDRFIAAHPTDKRAADATFVKGFIYANQLNDQQKAKSTYEHFLATYPAHELAPAAKEELANLGKSPEQILQEIQAKQ